MIDKVNKNSRISPCEIFEEIHAVMHLLRAEQFQVFRDCPYKLTHMEGQVLGYLARKPGATLSDLVAHSGRDKGQLAKLVKTLREHALIEAVEDASDRRSVKLRLTACGEKVQHKLESELCNATQVALGTLSQKDLGELLRLLRILRGNLDEAGATQEQA